MSDHAEHAPHGSDHATTHTSGSYIPGVIGLIALFGAAMMFISLPLKQFAGTPEPLADRESLQKLINGNSLSQPQENTAAVFHGTNASAPALASLNQVAHVLGTNIQNPYAEKRIEVDLTNQKVYAYEGNTKVFEFIVSTGKWGRTPTGEFTIWAKVKSQLMQGGNKAIGTYYYLPNVP